MKDLAENLDKSNSDLVDSVHQYSFELKITVKVVSADSAVVKRIRQLETGKQRFLIAEINCFSC